MNKKHAALTTLCLLAAVGCSAADTGDAQNDSGAADEAGASLAQPLRTVDVGEEQVTFYDGENGEILIGSLKPNVIAEFAVEKLEKTAGTQLTPLELFSALAPGETPPDRLVEDHAARVAGLGRANGAMLQVAFEPQHLTEKAWTPAQCDTALGQTQVVVHRLNNQIAIDTCTAITPGYPTGSCNVYVQTSRHRAGVCNNSAAASMNATAYTRHDTSSWRSSSAVVPRNGSYLWSSFPSLNQKLTGWQPSKMRLTAWAADGSGFHARLTPY